jgi:hypothetical protein
LPWDPVPLPRPGEGKLFLTSSRTALPPSILAGLYVIFMIAALVMVGRLRKPI